MGEGLGSSCLQFKPDESEVLPRQDIGGNNGDGVKQPGLDLSDEPLRCSLKDAEFEKKEEIEECREDGYLGNPKVGESDDREDRGLVEDNVDSVEDSVKKKVKGEGLEGKVQFSGRVLRSMSAVKSGSVIKGDKVGSGVDKNEDVNSSETMPTEMVKVENDQSHGEMEEEGLEGKVRFSGRVIRSMSAVKSGSVIDGDKVGSGVDKHEDGNGSKTIPTEVVNHQFHGEVEEEGLKGKVQFSVRVLRLMSAVKTGSVIEGDKVGSGVDKTEDDNGSDTIPIEVVKEGNDQSHGEVEEQRKVGKMEKRKRGRPPKFQGKKGFEKKTLKQHVGENDCLDSKVRRRKLKRKRKRGRPPKVLGNDGSVKKGFIVEAGENDQFDEDMTKESKGKRGRPRKVHENSGFEKKEINVESEGSDQYDGGGIKKLNNYSGLGSPMTRQRTQEVGKEADELKAGESKGGSKGLKGRIIDGRKKMGGLKRGRKKLRGSLMFNMPDKTPYEDIFDDTEKNESKASLMLRPQVVKVEDNEKGVKKVRDEGELRRSEAKQAVRDRIVNMLKAAGWTIDYRPRNNREYNDAVYVNPKGRTHWSVTLAYKMLKKNYEKGDSKVCSNGFVFTPIPEEELSILKRIVQKKRVGKKKPKGTGDDTEDGQVKRKIKRKRKWEDNEKKKKQKLQKGTLSLHEEKNSDGTLQRGTQVSSRKRKLHQTQERKRYALLVRSSMDESESDNNGYVLYEGKRTLLSWMIDSGTVPQDGKVEYLIQKRTRTRESRSGRITRDGIQCNCCRNVFAVAEFETHAGSKVHRPFQNICLETGVPLLQCLLDAWNKQQQSELKGLHFVDFGGEDPNDDTCGICGDGGDLICCDSCPSTFHQSCLDIETFPSGNWNCVYCTCKYCGMVGNMHQRVKDDNAVPTVLTCHLCEEKYHEPCIQPMDTFDDGSSSAFFCGKRCKEVKLH